MQTLPQNAHIFVKHQQHTDPDNHLEKLLKSTKQLRSACIKKVHTSHRAATQVCAELDVVRFFIAVK